MSKAGMPVEFEPRGRTVRVEENSLILDAAGRAGVAINVPCGGGGICGKCKVRVSANASDPVDAEKTFFTPEELSDGWRLACQSRVLSPMTVEVPSASEISSSFQILGGDSSSEMDVSDAPTRKVYVEMPRPGREDERPDMERLEGEIGPFFVDLPFLREAPGRFRAWDFRGTAVLSGRRLIDFEHGNVERDCFAAAFDIGTTTLAGVLLDLASGRERACSSRMNPQTLYGDDVISRIMFARRSAADLETLRFRIIMEVNDMIREMAERAGVELANIYDVVFAGNTTMQLLLEGVDPSALGETPFPPATSRGICCASTELGLKVHPRGRAYMFPVVGGFVGGDTVSGLLSTGLAESERPTVLIDIGTNGEIAVVHEGRILAASTAAGPAFEGARILHGMRAVTGAIEHVVFDEDVRFSVIGGAAPSGLCGTALIDASAELLRYGLLMGQGLLLSPKDAPDSTPEAILSRLVENGEGPAFVLGRPEETSISGPILLTQKDIRELQLAVAAIRAGFSILLKRVGLVPEQLDKVLIAGGFGNYIHPGNARRIGLLPPELPEERVCFVGNSSLAGARLAAASQSARTRAELIARKTSHVDLSMDPDFQMEYVTAMFFPESV
jgi:uncharacterized 2Fe-2S/4Fe-4S cluster protein (DUF4445 family)